MVGLMIWLLQRRVFSNAILFSVWTWWYRGSVVSFILRDQNKEHLPVWFILPCQFIKRTAGHTSSMITSFIFLFISFFVVCLAFIYYVDRIEQLFHGVKLLTDPCPYTCMTSLSLTMGWVQIMPVQLLGLT